MLPLTLLAIALSRNVVVAQASSSSDVSRLALAALIAACFTGLQALIIGLVTRNTAKDDERLKKIERENEKLSEQLRAMQQENTRLHRDLELARNDLKHADDRLDDLCARVDALEDQLRPPLDLTSRNAG